MPGLKPVSRYQIAFAMLMFLGSPAWIGLLVLGTLAVALPGRRRTSSGPMPAWRCSSSC